MLKGYVLSILFCFSLQSCFNINSKSYTFIKSNGIEHCNQLGLSYYQSIDLIIDHILYKSKKTTYHSEDGKHLKYIKIHLKIPNSYVLIYPDYTKFSTIELPLQNEKINPNILKQYKASRITYYIKDQIYDCIKQEYYTNVTKKETLKDSINLCRFINRPAKELLNYINADSSNTVLTTQKTYLPDLFEYYTNIIIKNNEGDSILIKTIPNININDYDQLKEKNVTMSMVAQFPIGYIHYYSKKNKHIISISCMALSSIVK